MLRSRFLGGTPDEVPERYAFATPRLTAGPRMVAVVGTSDVNVPPAFSVDPCQPGALEVVAIAGADHFDLIDPTHEAWLMRQRCQTDLVTRRRTVTRRESEEKP